MREGDGRSSMKWNRGKWRRRRKKTKRTREKRSKIQY